MTIDLISVLMFVLLTPFSLCSSRDDPANRKLPVIKLYTRSVKSSEDTVNQREWRVENWFRDKLSGRRQSTEREEEREAVLRLVNIQISGDWCVSYMIQLIIQQYNPSQSELSVLSIQHRRVRLRWEIIFGHCSAQWRRQVWQLIGIFLDILIPPLIAIRYSCCSWSIFLLVRRDRESSSNPKILPDLRPIQTGAGDVVISWWWCYNSPEICKVSITGILREELMISLSEGKY